MSISEFRYNKKRRHYAYIFKKIGAARKNILISSKPLMIEKSTRKTALKQKLQSILFFTVIQIL